jgi:hypothetical protein
MARTNAIALGLLAAALAGCRHDEPEQRRQVAPPVSGPVTVVERPRAFGAAYAVGDRVYGLRPTREVKLGASINTTLIATLSPAAVPSPDGRLLAYNAWRGRRPLVRVHELASRKDDVLDEGAMSLAWRADGALAYFKALAPDVRDPKRYRGHVVVRAGARRDAPPVRWTRTPGRYLVAAWAGRRLLAYRIGSSWPDLLVADAPGRIRVLAKAGALVAVSPDGGSVFVSTYGASPPVVRVLDVATGRELARRVVTPLRWVTESGSWAGNLVVAPANAGVAVFRVGARSIALEQALRFDAAGFTVGPFEPRVDSLGRRIVGWAELASRPRQAVPQAAVLDCDRAERRCAQTAPISSAIGVRLVYDPSRP